MDALRHIIEMRSFRSGLGREIHHGLARSLPSVLTFPSPVIARGCPACASWRAGGCAACDFRLLRNDAKFVFPKSASGFPSLSHAAAVAGPESARAVPALGDYGREYCGRHRVGLGLVDWSRRKALDAASSNVTGAC